MESICDFQPYPPTAVIKYNMQGLKPWKQLLFLTPACVIASEVKQRLGLMNHYVYGALAHNEIF